MTKKLFHFIFLVLFIVGTVFIISNSMKSATLSNEDSGFFVSFATWLFGVLGIPKRYDITHIVRKLAHITEFGFQATMLGAFFLTGNSPFPSRIIYVLFVGIFTASSDEFVQSFFDGRGSMVSDIFIDFIGTCLAVLLCVGIWLIWGKRKRKIF